MKKILLYLAIIIISGIFVKATYAQSLSPSVLPSAGGYFSAANGSLSWTMGETVIPTLTAGSNMLTQGFQQPEVQINTGAVITSICAGGSVSVPFTANGIISAGNDFVAQLSNAAGSFASPVNIGTLAGNASGTISATIPPATPLGSGYRIRVVSTTPVFNGSSNANNITITNSCNATVNLTLFIEGYYAGSSTMNPVLLNQGVSANSNITDSITVELHNTTTPFATVASSNVILNTNGTATCTFPITSGSYYLVIHHRNAIQTWSALPITLGAIPVSYNFSTASSKAYGGNMVQVQPGVWALYSGDIYLDENIDLLDLGELENDINAFLFGYYATDLNGDGNVDLLDSPILESNVNNFVFSSHP